MNDRFWIVKIRLTEGEKWREIEIWHFVERILRLVGFARQFLRAPRNPRYSNGVRVVEFSRFLLLLLLLGNFLEFLARDLSNKAFYHDILFSSSSFFVNKFLFFVLVNKLKKRCRCIENIFINAHADRFIPHFLTGTCKSLRLMFKCKYLCPKRIQIRSLWVAKQSTFSGRYFHDKKLHFRKKENLHIQFFPFLSSTFYSYPFEFSRLVFSSSIFQKS